MSKYQQKVDKELMEDMKLNTYLEDALPNLPPSIRGLVAGYVDLLLQEMVELRREMEELRSEREGKEDDEGDESEDSTH